MGKGSHTLVVDAVPKTPTKGEKREREKKRKFTLPLLNSQS